MSKPDDDTDVPSGFNDDAEMERTSPRVSNRQRRAETASRSSSGGRDRAKGYVSGYDWLGGVRARD